MPTNPPPDNEPDYGPPLSEEQTSRLLAEIVRTMALAPKNRPTLSPNNKADREARRGATGPRLSRYQR
jgi:hypothetical protein